MIHLDTHVLLWIVAGMPEKVPSGVLSRIETDDVACSPMVRLELTYLHEVGRTRHPAEAVLGEMRRVTALAEDPTPFGEVVTVAAAMTWTRDPFDRVITAQAVAAGCDLATADRSIRRAVPDRVLWD